MSGKKNEQTRTGAASKAGKTLQTPSSSKAEKSAAASALTQYKSANEQTSKQAASQAGKVLQNRNSSAAAMSAAGSALTQTSNKGSSSKKK